MTVQAMADEINNTRVPDLINNINSFVTEVCVAAPSAGAVQQCLHDSDNLPRDTLCTASIVWLRWAVAWFGQLWCAAVMHGRMATCLAGAGFIAKQNIKLYLFPAVLRSRPQDVWASPQAPDYQ